MRHTYDKAEVIANKKVLKSALYKIPQHCFFLWATFSHQFLLAVFINSVMGVQCSSIWIIVLKPFSGHPQEILLHSNMS